MDHRKNILFAVLMTTSATVMPAIGQQAGKEPKNFQKPNLNKLPGIKGPLVQLVNYILLPTGGVLVCHAHLIGVDEPSKAIPDRDKGFNYDLKASKFLEKLLRDQWIRYDEDPRLPKIVMVPPQKEIYVYRNKDSLFINEYIIRTGNGTVDESKDYLYKAVLLRAQELARKEKKGVWADPDATDTQKVVEIRRKENEARDEAAEEERQANNKKIEDAAKEAALQEAEARARTVRVTSVQNMLRVQEHPKEYVGKRVVVSGDIAMIIGDNFQRNSETDGYLFRWKCGATASGAEDLGNQFGLQNDKLNYWCDTDSGILVKEKLKAERSGDKIYYRRAGLTFEIKTRKANEFGSEREYYIAELTVIDPK